MRMPFPLSSDGAVSGYGVESADAVAAVTAMIEREEVATVETSGDRIAFTSADPTGLKSPVIGVIDSGTVALRDCGGWAKAQYRISFRRALTHVTILSTLAFGVVPVLLMGWHPASVLFVLAAWGCLFGGNYALGAARFRTALHRAMKACQQKSPSASTRGT